MDACFSPRGPANGGIAGVEQEQMLRRITTAIKEEMASQFKGLEAKISSLQQEVHESGAWRSGQVEAKMTEPTTTVKADADQVRLCSAHIESLNKVEKVVKDLLEQSASKQPMSGNVECAGEGTNDVKTVLEALVLLQAEQGTLVREFQQVSKMQNQSDERGNKTMAALELLSTKQDSFQNEIRQLQGQMRPRPRASNKKNGSDLLDQPRPDSVPLIGVIVTATPPIPIPQQAPKIDHLAQELEGHCEQVSKQGPGEEKRGPLTAPAAQIIAVVESEEAIEQGNRAGSKTSVQSTKSIKLRETGSLGSVFGHNDDEWENPQYHVEDYYWEKGINSTIAKSDSFANFTVLVVVFNAVYIGFESDYNDAKNIYVAHWSFQACSQFFCVYFTWELLVRFVAFKQKRDCFRDGWFKFDAFLVTTMILDTWILEPALYFIGGSVSIPTQPLRMLRLFKLTRMARLMKAFPELVTMIHGLVRSLRAIASSMVLIGLMVYVWAIMMHMLMKDEVEFNERKWRQNMLGFRTITLCMWTLLMDGTLMLDNAGPLMTELLFSDKFHYVLAGSIFLAYSLLSAMLILQMLIGVLCDVVSKVGAEQEAALAVGLVKQELLGTLQQHDGGDGKISEEELQMVMASSQSNELFKKLNVNRQYFLVLATTMFTHHKEQGDGDQQIPIKAILDLMIMCRGSNPTTVEGMAGGLLSIFRELQAVREMLERDMEALEQDLKEVIM